MFYLLVNVVVTCFGIDAICVSNVNSVSRRTQCTTFSLYRYVCVFYLISAVSGNSRI